MFLLSVIVFMLLPFALRAYTALRFDNRIYALETVPEKEVALVLGARVMPSGRLSAMLRDRVAAAVDLYLAGKVEYLLMSGAGTNDALSEPEAMRAYAIRLGVPAEAILLDPLGLRTYDSCYRARDVFGVDEAIVVTQDFHLDRALWLCTTLGLEVVGVAADYQRPQGYGSRSITYSQLREIPATVLAFTDLLRRPSPSLDRPSS